MISSVDTLPDFRTDRSAPRCPSDLTTLVWGVDGAYTQYTLQSPKVLHAGDKFHTHCEWNNTTASAMMFPDEMCAGIGFYFPSQGQIICENGSWSGK